MTASLFPPFAVEAVPLATANELLTSWKHPLGPSRRPFGSLSHVLTMAGDPVAVAVAASTVSSTCAGMTRRDVVELARIGRAPDADWSLRVLIRLWRVGLAPSWPYWTARAAVSYAMPGTEGGIYRFDGWCNHGKTQRSGGGGSWTTSRPAVNAVADGVKTLWVWHYDTPNGRCENRSDA